jgi:hypothetical protein
MGFFSSIIGGVTKIISGGAERKNDAKNRSSAEKLALLNQENQRMLLANESSQRAHELSMSSIKVNKSSFIPYVAGGVVGSILLIVAFLKKKQPIRRY